MLFNRKVYYDSTTGEIIFWHQEQGDIIVMAVEEEMGIYPALEGRSAEDTDCLCWTEPDEAVENDFANGRLVSVDVTSEPPELVFDFTPVELPPAGDAPTYAELATANEILMGREGQ